MKILILSDDFPPQSFGGAGIVAFRSSQFLQRAGYEIFVFSTCQNKKLSGQREVAGLPVFFLYNQYNLRWRGWLGLYNGKVLLRLAEQIKNFKPDVIHAHNVHTYISYAALKLAKKYCPKVFLMAHDTDIFYQDKFFSFIDRANLNVQRKFNYRLSFKDKLRQIKKTLNPFRNWIIRYYLKYLDKIFAVSQNLKKALNQNNINNVDVIYNGVVSGNEDFVKSGQFKKRFNINKDKKIILMAGRFNSLKGGGLVLEYIKEIKKSFGNFILVFAGKKNNYAKSVIKKAKKQNLTDYILFTGWLNQNEIKDAYNDSHLVITPSIYLDVFNLTNIEAMYSKKPVVGTCFGGTPEIIIDSQTGYVINPFDIKKTAKKIIELLSNDKKSKEFGRAGYQKVINDFSLEKQMRKILEYYNS